MKKMLFAFCLFLVFAACKNQSSPQETSLNATESKMSAEGNFAVQPSQVGLRELQDTITTASNEKTNPQNPQITSKSNNPAEPINKNLDRKIIRTAEMRFKVAKTENTTYKVEQIANKFGGYVTKSHMNSQVVTQKEVPVSSDSVMQITQYELQNNMTIRIPNNYLDTFLNEISRLYVFLDYRRVLADDVTLAYRSEELKAKLRQQAAQRINTATENKGKRLDDITQAVTVSTELQEGAVDKAISNLQKDFDVAYSVINLDMHQDKDIIKTTKANPSVYAYGPSFFTRLKESFSTGWAVFLDIFLGIISVWYLFALGGLVWILYKKYGIDLKTIRKTAV